MRDRYADKPNENSMDDMLTSLSQPHRRLSWTGVSLVPCAFCDMTSSSAMRGYLPVLAELKSLLNKWRCVAARDDVPTGTGANPMEDRSRELHTEKVSMLASFMLILSFGCGL